MTLAPRVAPRIAVVIPIFRHATLVAEAIESVLAQQAGFAIHLCLVNDGCPHKETHATCLDYARSLPDRITYLPKSNSGLSEARNHGIRYVLEHLPSVEAIYLLDADNRLRPPALARAMACLEADPSLGWVYPNIDMFGLAAAHDYGGPYAPLLHRALNICEAGSLVRRAVLEAGILFDPSFKQGFEDWEFFLSASEAGFSGANLEDMGFHYRKRPESMLAEATRDSAAIRARMETKHKPLFAPCALARLEQEDAPRYALYLSDHDIIRLTTDPSLPGKSLTPDAFEERFWLARANPSRVHIPPFLIVTTSTTLKTLQRSGLLHWAFWQMERNCEDAEFATLHLETTNQDRLEIRSQKQETPLSDAVLVMASPEYLRAHLEADPTTAPRTQPLTLALSGWMTEGQGGPSPQNASPALEAVLQRLKASKWREGALLALDWREGDLAIRADSHLVLRDALQGAAAYPRVKDTRHHIGLTVPIVEFGGVEKVALNYARALKSEGVAVHLFILERHTAALSPEWGAVLDSVNFLHDETFSAWGQGQRHYYGTELPGWAETGDHGPALAMLYWLDTVIDFHGGAFVSLMAPLKRLGLQTVTSLHLSDLSNLQRPLGNTYLALAYEHVFDLFAPCSERLADWLHAMGVPEAKILPVINAPSFPIAPKRLQTCLAARDACPPDAPLKVMYLGRLDPQKGLERLSDVVEHTQDLNLDWRFIGEEVVTQKFTTLSPLIRQRLEPVLTSPDALTDAYAAADVVLLLSDYEGLPLTILEAMRQGVVVIATDVGAVGDVLKDNVNGILLPLETAVTDCLAALERLSRDRKTLNRLSHQAARDMVGRDWPIAIQALKTRLLTRPPEQTP